jgi:hypothetical protein
MTVYDAGGNNNGHLDPGETVDLTSILKNIGGVDFTDLATTIECPSDPYITITDNSGYFGFLAIDSTKENTGDPYVVTVSSSTPQGHNAQFRLIATAGSFVDTFDFNLVVGTYNYLVWNPDPTPSSGQRIDSILTSIGFTGSYSINLPITELDMYQAIFVCVGIYSNNYIIGASGSEASALVDYLNNGGHMYLEGGDVWYYDPPYQGGYDFGPLFGIDAVSDGTGDLSPVLGESGTYTEGMNFTYSAENSFIDHIDPTGSGFLIFRDGNNNYNCGVANDAGTYNTVGSSFELGGLVDGSGVSTKAVFLDSVMHFFGIFSTGINEVSDVNVKAPILKLYPNPFSKLMHIKFQAPSSKNQVTMSIYDAAGRLVRSIPIINLCNPNKSVVSVCWDGKDDSGYRVSNGIYFVRLEIGDYKQVEKVILVE